MIKLKSALRFVGSPLVLTTIFLLANAAQAQANYELQVYGSDLVEPGTTMFELHNNFAVRGSKQAVV